MMKHTTSRKPLRAALVTFALIAVTLTAGVTAAGAGESATPLESLDSFTFTSQVTVESGDANATAFSVTSSGKYVAPDSQDCRVHVVLSGVEVDVRYVRANHRWFVDEGDGLEPSAGHRATSFYDLCPSDATYWEGFVTFPDSLEGDPVRRNGVDTEHFDMSGMFDTFGEYLPDGMVVEQMDLYVAADGGWPVALEMRVAGTTDETCQSFGTEQAGVSLSSPCAMTRTLELRRPNDHKLRVPVPKAHGRKLSA
jgi:hypothetical protein